MHGQQNIRIPTHNFPGVNAGCCFSADSLLASYTV